MARSTNNLVVRRSLHSRCPPPRRHHGVIRMVRTDGARTGRHSTRSRRSGNRPASAGQARQVLQRPVPGRVGYTSPLCSLAPS